MSEPGAGSDVVSMRMRPTSAASRYVLNGTKMWITKLAGRRRGGRLCQDRPRRRARAGSRRSWSTKGSAGFSPARRSWTSWACAAATPASWCSTSARCRRRTCSGEEGRGVNVLMSGLDYERAVLAAGPLGIMQACMDVVLPYIRERRQFGQPIGEFQLIQGKIADMYVTMNAAKAYVYSVAKACDRGETEPQGRGGRDPARGGAGDLDGARGDPGAGRQRLHQRPIRPGGCCATPSSYEIGAGTERDPAHADRARVVSGDGVSGVQSPHPTLSRGERAFGAAHRGARRAPRSSRRGGWWRGLGRCGVVLQGRLLAVVPARGGRADRRADCEAASRCSWTARCTTSARRCAGAWRPWRRRGASIVTVHGDPDMLRAAVDGRGDSALRVFAISVLTSQDDAALQAMGYERPLGRGDRPAGAARGGGRVRRGDRVGGGRSGCAAAPVGAPGPAGRHAGHPAGRRRAPRPEARGDAGRGGRARGGLPRGRPADHRRAGPERQRHARSSPLWSRAGQGDHEQLTDRARSGPGAAADSPGRAACRRPRVGAARC